MYRYIYIYTHILSFCIPKDPKRHSKFGTKKWKYHENTGRVQTMKGNQRAVISVNLNASFSLMIITSLLRYAVHLINVFSCCSFLGLNLERPFGMSKSAFFLRRFPPNGMDTIQHKMPSIRYAEPLLKPSSCFLKTCARNTQGK